MVVDRENNIQSEIVTRDGPHVPRDLHQASRDAQQALHDTQPRGGGDAASEAGTYTIDQVLKSIQFSNLALHLVSGLHLTLSLQQ
jgi:hypothetical protein